MAGIIRALLTNHIRAEGIWRPQTIKDLDDAMDAAYGGLPTFSGVNVSENLALNLPPVFACVRVKAETLGQLSLHMYRRMERGAQKAVDHRTYRLVHDEPDEERTSVAWRMASQAHVDTWGNAYCWLDIPLVGRNAGKLQRIKPLMPDRVRPFRDETGRLKYEYRIRRVGGAYQTVVYDMMEVLHVAGMGYDGIMGYSPIQYNRQCVGIGFAMEQYLGNTFGRGVNIRGVLTGPAWQGNEDKLKAFKESFREQYAGIEKSGGLMFLFGLDKFTPTVLPLEDAEFLAERKYTEQQIAAIYRVPPHMIANLERATLNNMEEMGLEFAMYSMMAPCRAWEQAMNKRLLTEREKEEYYFEFDLKSLMRGNAKSRGEWYKLMKEVGAYNANRILEAEGENPRDDPGGDKYWDEGPQGQGQGQKSLAKAMKPVFVDAAARIMKRECEEILAQAKRWPDTDGYDGFEGWLGEYWNRARAFCAEVLRPAFAAMDCPGEAERAAKRHINTLRSVIKLAQTEGIDGIKACLEARNPEDMPLFPGESEVMPA